MNRHEKVKGSPRVRVEDLMTGTLVLNVVIRKVIRIGMIIYDSDIDFSSSTLVECTLTLFSVFILFVYYSHFCKFDIQT